MGISSNTYNILASLFKHIFDENEFAPRGYTLIKGAYLQWHRGRGARGGQGGPWLPLLLRPVGKLSMLSEIVGKLSMLSEVVGKLSLLSEIVKVVDGRGGGVAEDLKCCPENFLVCRKKFSVCRKSTILAPHPPKKKHGSHGATAYLIILLF